MIFVLFQGYNPVSIEVSPNAHNHYDVMNNDIHLNQHVFDTTLTESTELVDGLSPEVKQEDADDWSVFHSLDKSCKIISHKVTTFLNYITSVCSFNFLEL